MVRAFDELADAYRSECREAGIQPVAVSKCDVDVFTGAYFLEDENGDVVCCLTPQLRVISIYHNVRKQHDL